MSLECYSCKHINPKNHRFCSSCGVPLELNEYIGQQIDARLKESTQDRDLVERESALRIFEKVFNWAKLVAAVGGGLLAILALITTWRFYDLRSVANTAQDSIETKRKTAEDVISKTAATATSDIGKKSASSVVAIDTAARNATDSSRKAQGLAQAAGSTISEQARTVRNEAREQAAVISVDVASARKQIQSAAQLEPQMQSLQSGLIKAQQDIARQQTILTSSEEFAKQVFSSRQVITFDPAKLPKDKYAILDAQPGKSTVVLYILLDSAPVAKTLQPQFFQIVASPSSFFSAKNLVIILIEKASKEELLGKAITISYFPDPSQKDLMKTLEVRDGRVFVDGEAFPKIGQSDPDFLGSKWAPKGQNTFVPQKDVEVK